jgi:hypothetical protein
MFCIAVKSLACWMMCLVAQPELKTAERRRAARMKKVLGTRVTSSTRLEPVQKKEAF